jgi:transcriptional regulator with XRE-family HTH domain
MTITGEMTITPEQVKAARELLGWTLVRLAARADASELAVRRYENGRGIGGRIDLTSILEMLEAAGIEFIAENGGGAGARLRKGACQK